MGNICRSPTAEGVLRVQAERRGIALEIDSCGTHAYHIGEQPDQRSQAHALQRGYDLSDQRARRVEDSDFVRFDLVLAMDRDNLRVLQAQCPQQYQHKVKLLLSYSSIAPNGEVPDPYYTGAAGFERVLDLIEDAVDQLLASIERES
ncbi:MAG: low molecular weight phosphotyrosine protein phosphatase [Burkholderiales bacterium]|nr:low molecular weight phosphotyrosine protein phosphatase [Burkholderiales bacterium]